MTVSKEAGRWPPCWPAPHSPARSPLFLGGTMPLAPAAALALIACALFVTAACQARRPQKAGGRPTQVEQWFYRCKRPRLSEIRGSPHTSRAKQSSP